MISVTVEKSAGAPVRTGGLITRVSAVVVGLTVAVAILAIAFALPAARSKPHDVPIGASGAQAGLVASMVQQNAPGAFRVTTYPDEAALRASIRDRDVYGGIAFGPAGPVLLTASGASPVVAQLLSQVANGLAKTAGIPLHAEDLAPPTAGDPRGAGLMASGLPVTVAGLLPAIALILLVPHRPWVRLFALLSFSVLAAPTIAVVLDRVVGAIDDNIAGVAAALLLGLVGAGLAVLGLGSLFGRVGLAVGSAMALLLGNPLSGLTSAPEMLPRGWGAFGQLLPQGATATLLRSASFFGGAGAGGAVAVLVGWSAAGAILVGIAALRTTARHRKAVCHVNAPAVWLGAGAITLGIGAALAGGSSVAHADTAHTGKGDNGSGHNGPAAPARNTTASVKAKLNNPIRTTGGFNRVVQNAPVVARQAPVGPPKRQGLVDAVLGWARREVRYTLFNRPPTITPVQHFEDPLTGVVTGDLHGSSATGGRLTYTVSQPDNALVHVNLDGSFTVTPDANTAHLGGTVNFSVTVDNGSAYRLPGLSGRIQSVIHSLAQRFGLSGADTSTSVVTVDVVATNQSPAVTGYTDGTTLGDGVVTGHIQAVDPNHDSLNFGGSTTSALGATVVVNSDGSFTYTPTAQIRHAAAALNAPDTATTDSFSVDVSDGYGGVGTGTINVPVSPTNASPTGGAIGGLEIDGVLGVVTGSVIGISDPDLDTLSYSSNPTSVGGGVVDVYGDGSFTYNPTAEQRHLAAAIGAPFTITHDSFTISVADGHGGSTAITIVVPVPPEVDEPPTGVAAG